MRFTVVTLFPEMFGAPLSAGVVGKAIGAGLLAVDTVNPRDFTSDRHRTVDDTPYGGGPGMVMKPGPLVDAIDQAAAGEPPAHRILLTPVGRPLDQARVRALATLPRLVIVCGRYEGIDERVSELAIDEELSIGDFVLSGGEPAALALIDAVARHIPGVLGEATSTDEESFEGGLLEYPQYTRPAEFRGRAVPEVLQGGNHAAIRAWRRAAALIRTAARRPDLLAGSAGLRAELAARTHVALVHHPVLDRNGMVVTTSVTNLDLHDIARSAATFGLAGYHVVTPVTLQREKVARIVGSWPHPEQAPDHRDEALARVRLAASIDEVIAAIESVHRGARPLVVASSARAHAGAVGAEAVLAEGAATPGRPLLLLLGTGWGLTDEVISACDRLLAPIQGAAEFNHLSVRSAAAVLLDRLFGDRGGRTA